MENWKPVAGWPYEVSDQGRVRRSGPARRTRVGLIRKSNPNADGYLIMTITRDRFKVTARVHTLVADAFLGPRPPDLEVNHRDGNKLNNRADNLEYVSHAANCIHARDNGLRVPACGKMNGMARLTDEAVKVIRFMSARGLATRPLLARHYRVTAQTVGHIVHRKTWRHVP